MTFIKCNKLSVGLEHADKNICINVYGWRTGYCYPNKIGYIYLVERHSPLVFISVRFSAVDLFYKSCLAAGWYSFL